MMFHYSIFKKFISLVENDLKNSENQLLYLRQVQATDMYGAAQPDFFKSETA